MAGTVTAWQDMTGFRCAMCKAVFGALTWFDKHQHWTYPQNALGRLLCTEPEALGLVQTAKGVWVTPEARKSRAACSERLKVSRQERL